MAGPILSGLRDRARAFLGGLAPLESDASNTRVIDMLVTFTKDEFNMATKQMQCPLCARTTRFTRVTEFIDHVWEKHTEAMSQEVDTRTIEALDAGLERRKIRDAELSAVKDRLAS